MSLTNEEREAIIAFRVQKAKSTLAEAEGIATLSYWNAVANRLYYSCFYMASALLIKHNLVCPNTQWRDSFAGFAFYSGRNNYKRSWKIVLKTL
jgi:hypothetical protein